MTRISTIGGLGAAFAIAACLAGAATAQVFGGSAGPVTLVTDIGTFGSYAVGAYDDTGNFVANAGYRADDPANGTGYHDYFVFDVGVFNQHVATATLVLNGYSISQNYLLTLGGYAGSPSDLSNNFGGVAAYTALGSGPLYATQALSPADANTTLSIALNGAAIAAINQGVDNFDEFFSIGGAATIAAVPEPSAWATMIAGFALIGASLRRRRPRPALA